MSVSHEALDTFIWNHFGSFTLNKFLVLAHITITVVFDGVNGAIYPMAWCSTCVQLGFSWLPTAVCHTDIFDINHTRICNRERVRLKQFLCKQYVIKSEMKVVAKGSYQWCRRNLWHQSPCRPPAAWSSWSSWSCGIWWWVLLMPSSWHLCWCCGCGPVLPACCARNVRCRRASVALGRSEAVCARSCCPQRVRVLHADNTGEMPGSTGWWSLHSKVPNTSAIRQGPTFLL